MPIKIDVQTNYDESELTIEKCSKLIEMLQSSYNIIRQEMYSHFLSTKQLIRSIVFAIVLALLYFLSDDIFFLYFMPLSVLLSLLGGVISAEYLTTQTRKQIRLQIQHFNQIKDRLIKDQKVNI